MEKYSRTEMEVIEFEDHDVIATTGETPVTECTGLLSFGGSSGGSGGGR